VDRGSGAKEKPFAPLEPTAPEEPFHPPERCLGEETPLTEGTTVLTLQGYLPHS
jgi:hypothetical protein